MNGTTSTQRLQVIQPLDWRRNQRKASTIAAGAATSGRVANASPRSSEPAADDGVPIMRLRAIATSAATAPVSIPASVQLISGTYERGVRSATVSSTCRAVADWLLAIVR